MVDKAVNDEAILKLLQEKKQTNQQQKEYYEKELQNKYKNLDKSQKASPEAVELIFDQFDTDKNGVLDFDETFMFFKNLSGEDIDEEDFKEKFKAIDLDGNGTVDKDELTAFLKDFYGLK